MDREQICSLLDEEIEDGIVIVYDAGYGDNGDSWSDTEENRIIWLDTKNNRIKHLCLKDWNNKMYVSTWNELILTWDWKTMEI